MALDEKLKIAKVITIHPERDMDVCTKFNGNPSGSFISLETKNVNRHGAGREVGLILQGPPMSVQNGKASKTCRDISVWTEVVSNRRTLPSQEPCR